MLKAVSVEAAGSWTGKPVDVVILNAEERTWKSSPGADGTRSFATVGGSLVAIAARHLPNIRTGDAFALESGGHVEIVGKPEALMEVRPVDDAALVRIAWQLGNHHLPMQIAGRKIRLRRNTEIAAILTGLGARVMEIEAPFDPEGGAYMPAVEHGHHHGDDCGCGHDHGAHDHHHHTHDHKSHNHKAHGHDHHDNSHHGHAHHGHPHQEHAHHKHEHHDHAHHEHGADCGCGHDHHAHADHGHSSQGHEHHTHEHHGHNHGVSGGKKDHHGDRAHEHEHAHGSKGQKTS